MASDLQLHADDPETWARTHFAKARMGHTARGWRAQTVAAAMAASPGAPIPQLFDRPYDVEAAYTLFDHRSATPDNLQHGHRGWVRDRLARPGTYLLLEDTTTVSFSHRHLPVPGLAAIGDGSDGLQGFSLHSVLAVGIPDVAALADDPALRRAGGVVVVGLADQQYSVRAGRPDDEPLGCGVNRRLGRPRESQRWARSTDRMGPAPDDPHVRWVRVADAEADIYDYLIKCNRNHYDFVVRLCQGRVALDDDGARLGTVWDVARAAPAAASYELGLRARPGQASRTAALSVSFGAIRVRAPAHLDGGAGPIACWFVRAWEESPPAGAEPLEWLLACGSPVATARDALLAVAIYSQRSLIEEFHEGLKTGLGAERLQLETAGRLYAAIAVMSVVALRLLELRERAWLDPDGPAGRSGLGELERELLGRRLGRRLETVRDVILAVGRLGGHMNRKADGLPGWLTLHRGMKVLRLMAEGARLVLPPPARPGVDGCG